MLFEKAVAVEEADLSVRDLAFAITPQD